MAIVTAPVRLRVDALMGGPAPWPDEMDGDRRRGILYEDHDDNEGRAVGAAVVIWLVFFALAGLTLWVR